MSEWAGDLRIDIEGGSVAGIDAVYQAAAVALVEFLTANNSSFTSFEWFPIEYGETDSTQSASFEAWWGANDGADLGLVLGEALQKHLDGTGWSASSSVYARPTSLY